MHCVVPENESEHVAALFFQLRKVGGTHLHNGLRSGSTGRHDWTSREAYWAYYKPQVEGGNSISVPKVFHKGLRDWTTLTSQAERVRLSRKNFGDSHKINGYRNPNKGCSPIIVQWQITSNNFSFFYLFGCCWKYK